MPQEWPKKKSGKKDQKKKKKRVYLEPVFGFISVRGGIKETLEYTPSSYLGTKAFSWEIGWFACRQISLVPECVKPVCDHFTKRSVSSQE